MTGLQEKKLKDNNNAIVSYKDNFLEEKTKNEKKEYKYRMIRRKQMEEKARQRILKEPAKFTLHNMEIINRSELTEAIIDNEIRLWFELNNNALKD